MKQVIALFITALILVSCDSTNGRFRLEGRFKNLNQGEFYIYNAELGQKDTIAVRSGRFIYDVPLADSVVFMLQFPNYSELPIFARPGITLKMNGDASHLRDTEVEGSDENEELTAFRLRANKLTPPEAVASARKFIESYPESPINFYLIQHYFLLSPSPDFRQAYRLCNLILKNKPDHRPALRLKKQLSSLRNAAVGSKLPAFSVRDTEGRNVSNRKLQSDVNLVYLWASWNYESQNMLRTIKDLQRAHPGKLSVISISMDAIPDNGKSALKRDSIQWSNICDGQLWDSPLLSRFGLATVPSSIITDKEGKVVARDLVGQDLKKKLESLLK